MLIKILKVLARGGRYSNKLMAKELEIDESLVEQMIERLVNMGYIVKEKINSCSNGCGCCSDKACGDASTTDIYIWKITEKGNRAIANAI